MNRVSLESGSGSGDGDGFASDAPAAAAASCAFARADGGGDSGGDAIRVSGVRYRRGAARVAIAALALEGRGRVYAVTGANGSGKSTFFGVLSACAEAADSATDTLPTARLRSRRRCPWARRSRQARRSCCPRPTAAMLAVGS